MFQYGNKKLFKKKYNFESEKILSFEEDDIEEIKIFEIEEKKNKDNIFKIKSISRFNDSKYLEIFHEVFIFNRLGKKCSSILQMNEIYEFQEEKNNKNVNCLNMVFEKPDYSLKKMINQKKNKGKSFSDKEIETLFFQLIGALSFLKERGVVHKDIKPSNIFIKDGNYKLGNFNISEFNETVVIHLKIKINKLFF